MDIINPYEDLLESLLTIPQRRCINKKLRKKAYEEHLKILFDKCSDSTKLIPRWLNGKTVGIFHYIKLSVSSRGSRTTKYECIIGFDSYTRFTYDLASATGSLVYSPTNKEYTRTEVLKPRVFRYQVRESARYTVIDPFTIIDYCYEGRFLSIRSEDPLVYDETLKEFMLKRLNKDCGRRPTSYVLMFLWLVELSKQAGISLPSHVYELRSTLLRSNCDFTCEATEELVYQTMRLIEPLMAEQLIKKMQKKSR